MKKKTWNGRWIALLALITVVLAGCGNAEISTLQPAGQVGKDQFRLLMIASSIMLFVIFVVVIIYTIALVRFRRSKVGEDFVPKQVEGSHTLELVWTIIPVILVSILAVVTVYYTYKLGDVSAMDAVDEDGDPEHLVVNVTAKLYWWEFEYPNEDIVTSQELVVPVGEKVYFNLISSDVKHSFWIPSVGGKLDTNVENVNKFYLTFDEESNGLKDGVFYGKCAELCGPSHALMDFKVKAVDRDTFDDWIASMQQTDEQSPVVDEQGEQVFAESCIGCHATSGVGVSNGIGESNTMGPNLATFGDRNRIAGYLPHEKEKLKEWVRDTEAHKPGNKMPSFTKEQISDEELDALADYLFGLKVEDDQETKSDR